MTEPGEKVSKSKSSKRRLYSSAADSGISSGLSSSSSDDDEDEDSDSSSSHEKINENCMKLIQMLLASSDMDKANINLSN